MTIAARLYLSFGLMALLVVGSAALTLHDLNQSRLNYENLNQNTRGAVLLATAQSALWQLRYGFPQFMVGDSSARAAIVADESKWHAAVNNALEAYGGLNISADEKRLLADLRSSYKKYVDARPTWFELYGSGRIQEASEYRARMTTPLGAAMVQGFNDLIALQQKVGSATQDAIQTSAVTIRSVVILLIAVSLLLAALVAYFLTRSIVTPLGQLVTLTASVSKGDFTRRMTLDRRDEFGALSDGFNQMISELTQLVGEVQTSGTQVGASITEIAATSREQQATASESAATTTEIGATSKEISATSKELVRTMNDVSRVAEEAAGLAGRGQTGLLMMEETMRHVMDAAGSISAKLAVLNEKAGNINQVVTTITKVADQTNLLSLNAAIEAEKAGEYGRGFAVVATEIRRLADQTAVATYDIEQMVKEIQSAVSGGVMGMDKFSEEVRRAVREVQEVGGQFAQVIQQVQALAPSFEAVNEGMEAQATGAEQISQALRQLGEAAQQTVESLRQSNRAIDGLNQASSTLRNGVSRFKLQA
jgi:methyl-accepting chemotaxis protein WspA